MHLQNYIRVISLVQKGIYYSEEDQRNLEKWRDSQRGSNPKSRMTLFHCCQRGRDSHIDVIDDY
jgi:hypothetical protein